MSAEDVVKISHPEPDTRTTLSEKDKKIQEFKQRIAQLQAKKLHLLSKPLYSSLKVEQRSPEQSTLQSNVIDEKAKNVQKCKQRIDELHKNPLLSDRYPSSWQAEQPPLGQATPDIGVTMAQKPRQDLNASDETDNKIQELKQRIVELQARRLNLLSKPLSSLKPEQAHGFDMAQNLGSMKAEFSQIDTLMTQDETKEHQQKRRENDASTRNQQSMSEHANQREKPLSTIDGWLDRIGTTEIDSQTLEDFHFATKTLASDRKVKVHLSPHLKSDLQRCTTDGLIKDVFYEMGESEARIYVPLRKKEHPSKPLKPKVADEWLMFSFVLPVSGTGLGINNSYFEALMHASARVTGWKHFTSSGLRQELTFDREFKWCLLTSFLICDPDDLSACNLYYLLVDMARQDMKSDQLSSDVLQSICAVIANWHDSQETYSSEHQEASEREEKKRAHYMSAREKELLDYPDGVLPLKVIDRLNEQTAREFDFVGAGHKKRKKHKQSRLRKKSKTLGH